MARILVAGSATLDFTFMLDEMPRSAKKYRARDTAVIGGGCAANAAVAIARLGGAPILLAPLGADLTGDLIVAGLEEGGVDCSLVGRLQNCRSSASSVYIDAAGERQVVNYRDPAMEGDVSWLPRLEALACGAVLADTRWPRLSAAVLGDARARGVPAVLDAEAPIGIAKEALQLATHVAFSAQGLADLTGQSDIGRGLAAAGKRLSAFVCATNGAEGAFHLDGNKIVHTPAPKITAVDTLGAGDVWHGAFALGVAEGMAPEKAIRFANCAAAAKCARRGGRAGYPARHDLELFEREQNLWN